jgi:hypothetical protein
MFRLQHVQHGRRQRRQDFVVGIRGLCFVTSTKKRRIAEMLIPAILPIWADGGPFLWGDKTGLRK